MCILVFSKGTRVEMGKVKEGREEKGGEDAAEEEEQEEEDSVGQLNDPMASIKMLHTKMNVHGVGETDQQLRELALLQRSRAWFSAPTLGS